MTKKGLKRVFLNHSERIERRIQVLKEESATISEIRIGIFIAAVLYSYFGYGNLGDIIYLLGLVAFITVFIVFVDRHQKVDKTIEKFNHLKTVKLEHIARMDLDWDQIPYDRFEAETRNHPFENDLNILGKHSLHHLLDTCIYDGSKTLLADWLLAEESDKELITNRQAVIKELEPLQVFRDKLRVISKFTKTHSSPKDWTMEQLLLWLRGPQKKGFRVPLVILSALSVSNITLGFLALLGPLPLLPFLISLSAYIVYYKMNDQKILGLFDSAFQLEKLLGRFGSILYVVEDFKFKKESKIETLLHNFKADGERPSTLLRRVSKLSAKASLQMNQVLWPLVNVTIPWDLFYAMKLEELKHDVEPKLTKWLDSFYELEALNALANFAMLNPDYSFPDFETDENTLFESKELGHPLIPDTIKVENDFVVQKEQDLFLITGSNMAGKSTFLRTVGINLVLAFSGAPVNAQRFSTQFFRVFTSINVTDSLGDGLSHFYAEVKRLRQLLDELAKEDEIPLFFFVDEIYKGTNNRERYSGSAAFLREVAGKHGVGMVSTHDLELASLEEEIPQLSNWHFAESIEDGKMSFEYKMKAGPCPSTNALHIMKIEGLPTGD